MTNWVEKEGYSTKYLASNDEIDCKNSEIQLVRLKKGKYSHYHKKKTEIFYFIKGYGKAIIDGKEIFLKSGTFIIVKPNVRHTFINESENILEAINIKTNNDPKDTYAD